MNLDRDFFQVSKLSEDQKKVFTKNGTLFSPNSSGDLRSDADQSQIIGGGMQMYTILKLLGGIYPPRFWHPWTNVILCPTISSTAQRHK